MTTSHSPDGYRVTLGPVALRFLVWALTAAIAFTLLSAVTGMTPLYWARLISYLVAAAVAVLFRDRAWTGMATLTGFYLFFLIMPIVDLNAQSDLGYSARTTMGMSLLILALSIPLLAPVRARWMVPAFAASNGTWVLITGLLAGVGWPVMGDELVVGVLGYLLLIVMTRRLLEAADRNAAAAARSAALQEVLTEASETLLSSPAEGALQSAVDTVCRAMGWDVLAIEEVDASEGGHHRVVSVAGDRTHLARLDPGPVAHLRVLGGVLAEEHAVEVETASLPADERNLYSGIHRELCCPVYVASRLVGSVSAFLTRPGPPFPDDERRLLKRLAEMIGSYREREAALDRLEDMLQSKDRFIASVSHELRTPLTAVVGFTQVLARDGLGSMEPLEVEELLQLISGQTAEVSQIVEDLLVAARADSGLLTVSTQLVELRREVDDLMDSIGVTQLGGRSVRVTGGPAFAMADPLRLRQILRNLVTNATRYGGLDVEVEIATCDDRVTVTVSDDGPGIPEDKRASIFEPYATAHTPAGLPGSMGLGLSVSRDLARLMQGDLTLKRSSNGAEFVVSLPAAPVNCAAPALALPGEGHGGR